MSMLMPMRVLQDIIQSLRNRWRTYAWGWRLLILLPQKIDCAYTLLTALLQTHWHFGGGKVNGDRVLRITTFLENRQVEILICFVLIFSLLPQLRQILLLYEIKTQQTRLDNTKNQLF